MKELALGLLAEDDCDRTTVTTAPLELGRVALFNDVGRRIFPTSQGPVERERCSEETSAEKNGCVVH